MLCGGTHVLDEVSGAEGVLHELSRLTKLVALRLRGWEAAEQLPSLASLSRLTALDAGMAGTRQQQPQPQQLLVHRAAHYGNNSDPGLPSAAAFAGGCGPSRSHVGTWACLLPRLPRLRHLQLSHASAPVLEQLASALAAPGAPPVGTLVLPDSTAFTEEGEAAGRGLSALGTLHGLVQLSLW